MAQFQHERAVQRMEGAIKASVLVALVMGALAFAPALSCWSGDDAASEDLERVSLGGSVDPDKRTFGQCVAKEPPTRQRMPMGLGLISVFVAIGAGVRRRGLVQAPREGAALPATLDLRRNTVRIEAVKQIDRDVRGHGKTVVEAIDVSHELDLHATPVQAKQEVQSHHGSQTLMDMVAIQLDTIQEREEQSRVERVTVEGFYCPRRLLGKPILYVDPKHEAAQDGQRDESSGTLERPFRTITAALEQAAEIVSRVGQPVQVRVMPGVYQESIKIPTKVSVINHRMPGEGGLEEHLAWLMTQQEVDHPERVTILAPPNAPLAAFFEPGTRQGLYGCQLICREGISQVGLGNERSTELMVRSCVISGFKLGGMQLNRSGAEAPGLDARVEGCWFTENEALKGGGLAIRESIVAVHHCVFERNVAQSGGAIFASEPKGTLTITYSKFYRNTAKADEVLSDHVEELPFKAWFECQGTGGAVGVERGAVKLAMCDLRKNGASNAGGALSLISSKALLQGSAQREMLLRSNRARQGGAIFAVGRQGARSTIKATHVKFEQNLGQSLGGALGLIGMVAAHFTESQWFGNVVQGEESLGGAVGCLLGAEFIGEQCAFKANKARGAGGALAARNGSVRLKSCSLQDNICEEGRGAGLYVESLSGARLDKLLEHGELQVPFNCRLVGVEFLGNVAAKPPSALFVGNMTKTPTLPIVFGVAAGAQLRGNRVQGQQLSESVAVIWAGERRMGQSELDAQPEHQMTLG